MVISVPRRGGYDVKITLRKVIEIFVYGGVGALISYFTGLPQTETVITVIAILKAIQNYLKNRNV